MGEGAIRTSMNEIPHGDCVRVSPAIVSVEEYYLLSRANRSFLKWPLDHLIKYSPSHIIPPAILAFPPFDPR